MKRVVIVHGWGGKPGNHFKPWLKKNLEEKGFEVLEPAMPHTDDPVFSEWLPCLVSAVGIPDQDTYFVGHSLGCVTVVRYIAGLSENEKVGGAVLVAGFFSDIGHGDKIETFYTTASEVEKAKLHCQKFVSIFSDNDSSVPYEKGKELNDALAGEFVLEHAKGHFCEEDGVTELPSALDAIVKMAD